MSALAVRTASFTENPVVGLAVGLPLAAALAGAAMAADTRLGIAFVMALIYLPIALTNLQLALALWIPLVFLEGLPAFNLAAKVGGLLLVGVWVANLGNLREHVAVILRHNGPFWIALFGLLVWFSLSILWAEDRGMVLADVWHYYAVALLMLIVATTVTDEKAFRMTLVAFVVGAVLGVAEGILSGGLTTSSTAIQTAAAGRLEGGQGDSNFLAAGIVPAMVLAGTLLATMKGAVARTCLVGALILLSIGLAASQSRGGALAAGVALLAMLVVYRRRMWVVAVTIVIVGAAAAWFAVTPNAWERISRFDEGGTGRLELWKVAWRVTEASPIQGAALNNFPVVSGDFVREPGSLDRLDIIVDRAAVVHSLYLQTLAETGVIGLGLLLMVVIGGIYAAGRAAQRFDASGERGLDLLARGVIIATIGFLAASLFISSGFDKRLWILLGLGPALLALSRRASGSARTLS